MIYLLPAYLIGLLYFTAQQHRIVNKQAFRVAWRWFIAIPMTHAGFTFIRSITVGNAVDMAQTEIWANGFTWFFLAMSMLNLLYTLLPKAPKNISHD
ncbi:MAG TPA: hypothetical protein ENL03_02775 [Phycisphaerae bacterium]|nr:hypothetical protein [Phycisphaerae bacterium]